VTKVSPVAKILLYLLLIIAVFLSPSIKVDLVLLIIVLLFTPFAPVSRLFRGMVPIMLFLSFTFFSNILFQSGRIVFNLFGTHITEEGLLRGGHLTLRLLIMIIGAKLLTATTDAEELVKAFARLMGPAGRLRFVKEFVSTTALTLSFLPIIYDEARSLYRTVLKESKANSISERIKLAASLITPLFERSMKRAKEIAKVIQ
jgi:energy-coupling factor transport system permease protein